ncbi:MAG: hypothetical protein KAI74_04280, partial [Kiritimatiellae bacterium]|nr:hypothetical protein [Kiritimatiellia bacterium]
RYHQASHATPGQVMDKSYRQLRSQADESHSRNIFHTLLNSYGKLFYWACLAEWWLVRRIIALFSAKYAWNIFTWW